MDTQNDKICTKCKVIIENRQYATCSICTNSYHIECESISFARFKIWTQDFKKSWKCRKCLQIKVSNNNITPPACNTYVNLRSRRNKKDIVSKDIQTMITELQARQPTATHRGRKQETESPPVLPGWKTHL